MGEKHIYKKVLYQVNKIKLVIFMNFQILYQKLQNLFSNQI